jgi:hypothetical protein
MSRLPILIVALSLTGCAGLDALPASSPMPETAAAPIGAPAAVPASAPALSLGEQWRSPFAAEVLGEVNERDARPTAVRLRPADQRIQEISWGPLADRAQQGAMVRAQVSVTLPAVAARSEVAATRVASAAGGEIE